MLLTLVAGVIVFLMLITVHELGHFFAAKALGVKVEKFSLGFPPKIWSKKVGETIYQICLLPLGGFVSMIGEDPSAQVAPEDVGRSFTHKPAWVQVAITLAGPIFNIIFAFLVLWLLVFFVGFQHMAPTIGLLPTDGPAYAAGLRPGDVVLKLDDQDIKYYDQIDSYPEKTAGEPIVITVERAGQIRTFTVTPVKKDSSDLLGDKVTYWSLGLAPKSLPRIDQAFEGKPAALAGLKSGDLVTAIDGQAIVDWSELVEAIQGPLESRTSETGVPVKPMVFDILRDGQAMSFTVTPKLEPSQGLDGKTVYTALIGVKNQPEMVVESIGPIKALGYGAIECWNIVKLTYQTLARLIQTKISPKVMGGPILIVEAAGSTIRQGLADFVFLIALISINLGIINLVPLPVLDGGQIFLLLIEVVRGKRFSLRFREITQSIGVCALVALIILVFYNDISRIVVRKLGPPAAQVQTLE